eukprot:evm.model.scf_674.1 EVM.evm.TU.scf_674.1   scf_674:4001-5788(-)
MAASMPFKMAGLDHVVLRVRDVPKVLAFYREVLGCEVVRANEGFGMWNLSAGGSLIDVLDVNSKMGKEGGPPPQADGHNVDHFALKIRPFDEDAILAHLSAHGITAQPAAMRYGAEGVGPSIYVKDPEGNGIELKGPPAQ